MRVGVLDLQGSVEEHYNMIIRAGDEPVLINEPGDMGKIERLIIPGGESTTLSRLLRIKGLDRAIISASQRNMVIWGTCAGMILLSKKHLNLIDVEVTRNYYGRQSSSFITHIKIAGISPEVAFIRAPVIKSVGNSVEILSYNKGDIVACKNSNILVTSFHPELGNDLGVYNYFKTI